MSTTYLIKGARVLGGEPTDLLLRDGVVAEIGGVSTGSTTRDDVEVVDATGLVALPGLVDLHTHLREPGREDAETVETGTMAAALGGFTAIHRMIALRNYYAILINGIAALYFIVFGAVDWSDAAVLTLGQVLGGWLGARTARRLSAPTVRWVVVGVGVAMAASLFLAGE